MVTCLSIQYVAQPFRVTCLSIQYVIQPFRVKPGDKGAFRGTGEPLGGTWGHMVTCLSIQYVTQPFRVYPGV